MNAQTWDLADLDLDAAAPSLAGTLDELEVHLTKYIYFGSPHDAVAVALFCAGTFVYAAAETYPLLAFMSPVRRSGKTRAMDAIEPVVARPWRVIRPSESVLFRKIDRDKPTLMLDEIDTIWSEKNEHEGLRSILNAGNRKGTTVARTVAKGKTFDLVDFEIYTPKILAGIGTLPETIRDRAIVISMVRKGAGDRIERLRTREAHALGRPIGDALARCLIDVTDLTLEPSELPDELDDRAQDGWEPLLALAKLAGGHWPQRAREAAVALSSERDDPDDESLGILLLRDIRTALGDNPRLTTAQLIERLLQIELAPWGDMYGKSVTGRKLSKLLRPFGIKPHRDRVGSVYAASQFVDAWSRYLPREAATSVTTATPEQIRTLPVAVPAVVVVPAGWTDGDPEPDDDVDPDLWQRMDEPDADPPTPWQDVTT